MRERDPAVGRPPASFLAASPAPAAVGQAPTRPVRPPRSGLRSAAGRAAGKGPIVGGGISGDPQWYRDAVIYEVHVRAFQDSNGDGIGDFRGLTERLDYLCDLGVTALWLLPFYPSPMRDDGYDIADYVGVNPAYGTLRDVETLIREAHRRGLRVITELVCNHTSDQHPWFQRARLARPGSAARNYYVWSGTPDRYPDARIIFTDFETSNWTWDAVAGAYYWHRFYAHQPDLNFDNPRVREGITRAMDFWLDRGVDGLRLDAVPYLYERDGTDCENLPETHAFLRDLRRHVDEKYGDRMLLAEANQWPEDSAAYFGKGDECHMAFNFPVMPRMFMAIRMEDRLPIVDIVEQTPPIPDTAQWALFLRNHDELTLEMVTDEERDYMYRVYADDPRARVNVGIRRRLAPLLGNHRRRIELINGLLFSMPGTPVIYYGDEIGMGDNVYLGDRDSVRTPMQWSGDRNAGFSTANREQLYLPVVTDPGHDFAAVNVSAQQADPHSLLWWMKRLIALRKRHTAFGRGNLEFLYPDNRHVLAFIRSLGDETILVVANLSRFFQPVELDLAAHEGRQPVEMFGRVEFPTVGRAPYPLSLGPHEFLWFTLEHAAGAAAGGGPADLDTLPVRWAGDLLDGTLDNPLSAILLRWIVDRPWYRGRGRRIKDGEILDRIEVPASPGIAAPAGPASAESAAPAGAALLIVLRVNYSDGEPDTYLVPLTTAAVFADSLVFADGIPCRVEPPGLRIAGLAPIDRRAAKGLPVDARSVEGFLVDATLDPGLAASLIDAIVRRRRVRGARSEFVGRPESALRSRSAALALSVGDELRAGEPLAAAATADVALHLRRVLEPGSDPESEVVRFLTRRGLTWVPRIVGELEYLAGPGSSSSAGLLRDALASDGNLAESTRHALLGFLEQAAAMPTPAQAPAPTSAEILRTAGQDQPEVARDLLGSELEIARATGRRVGELHRVLASAPEEPAFAPERFTRLYQKSVYQSVDALANRAFRLLADRSARLEGPAGADAAIAVGLKAELADRLRALPLTKFGGSRIRIHGALDLGRVQRTDHGLVIVGLEGDTRRAVSERRLKRSALRDVASMLHSFHDLSLGRLRQADIGGSIRPEDGASVEVWARQWCLWTSAAFVAGYRETVDGADFLPAEEAEWVVLLDTFRLAQALDDLISDLRGEPDRLPGSIRGLLELLGH
jgi:maltose alpha-D-glucosyltransferase/alpha-amylase